jgi:UDP-glucuronate 4-epimerase
MLRGETIPIYGDGSALRDFTFVDDLVDGLVRAVDADLGYRILNLGAGRSVVLLDVVRALERELGVPARLEFLPRQPGEVTRTWADTTAAREALGYQPRTTLAQGIARFASWLRQPG